MAMSKTYMTVNGKIRSEHRAGEVHARDYMHDPSGNVIGVYVNGWLNGDACYMPWGATLASWNMDSSYKFMWMGGWGYRQTNLEWSSTYVRARHYSHRDGAWTTRDPLWPSEMPYGYVNGRVLAASDPSGLWCYTLILHQGKFEGRPTSFIDSIAKALSDLASDPKYKTFIECVNGCNSELVGTTIDSYAKNADHGNGCVNDFKVERDTGGAFSNCGSGDCAIVDRKKKPPTIKIWPAAQGKDCGNGGLKCLMAHELLHVAGIIHTVGDDNFFRCVRQLTGCENFRVGDKG